jgi:hypothetical protein
MFGLNYVVLVGHVKDVNEFFQRKVIVNEKVVNTELDVKSVNVSQAKSYETLIPKSIGNELGITIGYTQKKSGFGVEETVGEKWGLMLMK